MAGTAKAAGPPLSPRILTGLGLLLLAAALPLYRELPGPLGLYLGLLFALHLLVQRYPRLRPGRWVPLLLAAASIWLVLRQFHSLFGFQAGISLFALLLALKALESRSERDLHVTTVIGLFFLVTQFLVDQSMYLAFYALLIVLGLLALLQQHHRQRPAGARKALGFALLILLQALPLAAVLFLLFPRLDGPIWSLNLETAGGVTGLSETMAPGTINRLAQSDEPVFRAEFDGPMPARELLYWRGPVLWYNDGRVWTRGRPYSRTPPQLQPLDPPLSYRLLLEPTGKPWVLALDLPSTTPAGTELSLDFQLTAKQPINQRQQFRLESVTRYQTGRLAANARRAALQLPSNVSQRMRNLAAGWSKGTTDPWGVVEAALAHFHREPFVYTLNPPLAGRNPDDAFLFETRAGFCEHYASAFTLLMRSAGIPSRVVTGYLGGEYNGLGRYLMVRQSDAHAWSEVWIEGRGWARVDPTAAVAPERILQEIRLGDDALGSPVNFGIGDGSFLESTLRRTRMALDAVNTSWHIWVLSYDSKRRTQLLEWLGLGFLKPLEVVLMMIAILGLIMAILGLSLLLRGGGRRTDPARRLYDRFCRRLARVGVMRAAHEGPEDFAHRAVRTRRDLERPILRISALYTRLRYGRGGTTQQLRELRRLVRGFRPRPKKRQS